MLGTDENKPAGKPGQRKRKAKQNAKTAQDSRKSDEQKIANADQFQDSPEPADVPNLSGETSPAETSSAETSPAETAPTVSADSAAVIASAEIVPINVATNVPISVQAIADAYGDYSKKSFEQTRFFFEKLAGTRSLGKALELQTDFFKQACETLIADSQRIRELHRDLARQNLQQLETWSVWGTSRAR